MIEQTGEIHIPSPFKKINNKINVRIKTYISTDASIYKHIKFFQFYLLKHFSLLSSNHLSISHFRNQFYLIF
jgi:hypothetical protein